MTSKSSSAPDLLRGDKTQFINDQQVLRGQLFLQALQFALILSFNQIVDQCCRCCEAHFQPSLTRGQSQPQSDVRLACPRWSQGDDIFSAINVITSTARQCMFTCMRGGARSIVRGLFKLGMILKSKLSKLFVLGNFAALMRRSIMRRSRSINSISHRCAKYWIWSLFSAAHIWACLRTPLGTLAGGAF